MIVQDRPSQSVPSASTLPISSPARVAPARAPVSESAVTTSTVQQNLQQAIPIERLSAAVNAVNETLSRTGSSLQFTIDRETDAAVVTVVDSNTGTVIRQIPSEEALAITRSIDEMLQRTASACGSGILCKQTA